MYYIQIPGHFVSTIQEELIISIFDLLLNLLSFTFFAGYLVLDTMYFL